MSLMPGNLWDGQGEPGRRFSVTVFLQIIKHIHLRNDICAKPIFGFSRSGAHTLQVKRLRSVEMRYFDIVWAFAGKAGLIHEFPWFAAAVKAIRVEHLPALRIKTPEHFAVDKVSPIKKAAALIQGSLQMFYGRYDYFYSSSQ